MAQSSALLMKLGAVDGEVFATREWWRLLTSQFLHVQPLHMLFNAMSVGLIAGLIEHAFGGWRVGLIYFVGGSLGQAASVLSYPALVSSGASQALMALCGAASVLLPRARPRALVLVVVAIQAALDLHAAHTIKTGHAAAFLGGLVIAGLGAPDRSWRTR